MEFIHQENRVVIYKEDTVIAEVTFPTIEGDIVEINHTFVDDSLRGQGIAGKLMEEVVKQLKETNKRAVLTCSFAVSWFNKHSEYQDLVVKR